MLLSAYGTTDTGRVRTNNEDSFLCDIKTGLFIVADGMGGHIAGEVASKQAIEIIHQNIKKIADEHKKIVYGHIDKKLSEWSNYLVSSFRIANSIINQSAQNSPAQKGMGTTVAAVYFDEKKKMLSCAHVGDSRIYSFVDGNLQKLTEDHTMIAEQLRLGIITKKEAAESQYQNVLSRAIGSSESVEVDVMEWPVIPGSYILICSDGLTRMVGDEKISEIFLLEAGDPCKEIADRLVKTANDSGGRDNITVIVIKFLKESLFGRIFSQF